MNAAPHRPGRRCSRSTTRSSASSRASRAPAPERAETVSTFDALGRVLAADVRSQLDVPPADNSAMDGYALRAADVAAPGTVLPVSQRIPAGSVGAPLAAGHGGAHLHRRADAAPAPTRSSCRSTAASSTAACASMPCRPRRPVDPPPRRRRRRGARVLARRHPPDAAGARPGGRSARRRCRSRARPRVALFSTGDELVMPGEPLKPGAIYNSNRFILRGLLEALGCDCDDLGIVPDRLDATRDALRRPPPATT